MRASATAASYFLPLLLLVLSGCSDEATSPLRPTAEPTLISADVHAGAHGHRVARVAGSLIRVPHSWPFVNGSTIRGLNATLDEDGNPDGSFELDIEIDFGAGPFLQQTSEEVICLEIVERSDGATDIWISHAGLGWVTVPEGVTHFSILHILDAPDGDLLAARTIHPTEAAEVEPSEFCKTRPDLSATNPSGLGPVELMAPEAGNVVSIDRR